MASLKTQISLKQLGSKVAQARLRRNISQDALASMVGVSRSTIGNLERGYRHTTIQVLCEVAEALGTTVSELLGEKITGAQVPLHLLVEMRRLNSLTQDANAKMQTILSRLPK